MLRGQAPAARYRFDYQALHRALNERRKGLGLSWNQLATQLRIAPQTLHRTEKGGPMEADGIRTMVSWLGLAPEFFVRARTGGRVPKAMRCLPTAGPGLRRFDKKALVAAIEAKRDSLGLSWNQVAAQMGGVSLRMLKDLARGGRSSMDFAVTAAGWLGQSIETFTYESPR